MEQQLVLDPTELGMLSIECSECHSQFVVDMNNDRFQTPFSFSNCPTCNTPWPLPVSQTGVPHPVYQYIHWLRQLRAVKHPKITFRLKATPWQTAETPKGQ
jgi:hypothetical protein